MEDSMAPSSGGSMVLLHSQDSSQDPVFCSQSSIHSSGFWGESNLLQSTLPLLILQVSITVSITRVIELLLKPLKQPKVISEILGGILIGPSFLGRFKAFSESIFSERSNYVRETIAEVALMYYIFLICVRVDLQLIGGRGRQPVVIGVCCLLLPFFTVFTMVHLFHRVLGNSFAQGPVLVGLCSAMSFSPVPVIFPILKDLHLLNSGLGRISMSASMTNDVAGWLSLISFGAIKQYNISARRLMWFSIALVVQLAVTVFMIRPAMHWIIRQTPEGKPVKHRFVVSILLGVLVMGFFSDLMGASNLEGPMLLGVVVPDGSVLSLTLLERTETILSCFLFPLFFCSFGLKTNLFTNSSTTLSGIVAFVLIVLGCQVAKMVGTIAPSLYYDFPFSDALVLSMILSFKGLVEVFTYVKLLNSKVLDEKAYTVLVLSIILTTSIISPIVVQLTSNTRRFKPYTRRTIQHSMNKSDELRILTCIHNQDQVSGIIHILDASNSTPHRTISLYLFHLVELLGRPSPLLITHHHSQHLSSPRSHHANSPIITAFKNYELRNEPGAVTLNAFTDISPFATMHEDICSVALDHSISLILLPFHKQWSVDRGLNIIDSALQIINPNVVAEAPCSVGLLIDRSTTTCTTAGISSQLHRIAAIFIGGPHDREVLSYAACMAGNSRVRLTVVRFIPDESHRRGISRERQLDEEVLGWFREWAAENKRVVMREERVTVGEEILAGIRHLGMDYDLMMVGRSHGLNSALLEGLLSWSDNPELGVIGDMLASADFSHGRVSVLVIQQQLSFTDISDTHNHLGNNQFRLR